MIDSFLIYVLYLFYGLAFFTLGVAITSRDTSFSNLKFSRCLWLLALFAFTHAVHEWFEIFFLFHANEFPLRFLPVIIAVKLLLTLISFLFLLAFGLGMLSLAYPQRRRLLLLPAFLLLFLLLSLLGQNLGLNSDSLHLADLRIRNFIALPGALFSGIGFLLYANTVRPLSQSGATSLQRAGTAMLVYSLFAGLIPSTTTLPLIGVPVEVVRALSAFALLHFTMRALHIFDIEWRALIEDRLNRFAQSEKLFAIGKLAAGIAHEINNPLANIQLNVEMLKGKLTGLPEAANYLRRVDAIETNVERASKIARELLVFSREKETALKPTSLGEVIESTLALLGPRLNDYRVRTEYGATAPVMAIPWKLEEVFLNLLSNSMEATPVGGTLSLRTYQSDSTVIAEVEDSGSGVPPAILSSIFDPFFTTKEVGKGTGLGLSICFGIMAAHGGKIEVQSEAGLGTKMILSFPAGAASHG